MATGAEAPSRTVLWFRNDLRVHDNAIVHEAAQRVKTGQSQEVQCLPACRVLLTSWMQLIKAHQNQLTTQLVSSS